MTDLGQHGFAEDVRSAKREERAFLEYVHDLEEAIAWMCTEMPVGWEEMAIPGVVETVKAALLSDGRSDGDDV